jgi:hypothetical protein
MESSDPIDIEDIDRVIDGEEEFIESVKLADRSTDEGAIDLATDGDGFLADPETNGLGSRRIPSALTL